MRVAPAAAGNPPLEPLSDSDEEEESAPEIARWGNRLGHVNLMYEQQPAQHQAEARVREFPAPLPAYDGTAAWHRTALRRVLQLLHGLAGWQLGQPPPGA